MFWDMMGWMFGEKDTNVNENKKHQKSAYLKAMTIHGVKDGRGLFGPTYIGSRHDGIMSAIMVGNWFTRSEATCP